MTNPVEKLEIKKKGEQKRCTNITIKLTVDLCIRLTEIGLNIQ